MTVESEDFVELLKLIKHELEDKYFSTSPVIKKLEELIENYRQKEEWEIEEE
jgi:hypothetical protein